MHPVLKNLCRASAALFLTSTLALGAVTPPKPKNVVNPVHPPELMSKGVEGHAALKFQIGEDGRVSEVEIVEATEPAFGDAAKAAVSQWTFEPGLQDGAPASMRVSQQFKFDIPPEKKFELIAGRPVFVALEGEVVPAKSLKTKLKPITPITPLYPKKLAGSGKAGVVNLKFVVNTDGLAVNPEVIGTKGDPSFAPMAMISVLRARWEPMLIDGKPVNVMITRPLQFKEGKPQGAPQRRREGGGGGRGGDGDGGGFDGGGGDGGN